MIAIFNRTSRDSFCDRTIIINPFKSLNIVMVINDLSQAITNCLNSFENGCILSALGEGARAVFP